MRGKSKALLLIAIMILSGCELFEPMDNYSGSPGFGCFDPIVGTMERLGCNLVDDSDHCYQDAAVRLGEPEYCTGIENGPPRDKCYLRTSLRAENPKFCELIEEVPGGYSKAECYSRHAVMKGDKSLCNKITKPHSTFAGSWSKESCLKTVSENTEVQDCKAGDDQCNLKNAMISQDPVYCDTGSDEFKDQCIIMVATAKEEDLCGDVSEEARATCGLMVATANEDPTLLEKYIPEEEMDFAIASYSTQTLDFEKMQEIEDNEMYDQSLLYATSIAFARENVVPTAEYCQQMRGDYDYDPDGDLEADRYQRNLNMCHTYRTAFEDLRDGTGCDEAGSRVKPYLGYTQEEISRRAIADCEDFVREHKSNMIKIEGAATQEEAMQIMQELYTTD